MWRRTRGGIDKTKAVIVKSLECFQRLEQHKLWEVENSDLCSGYGRILELTSRTIVVGINTALGMEKIDTQGYGYKEE